MIEWIKSHKVWVIGGAVAVALLYLLSRHGTAAGSSSASSGAGTDVAAATALQQAQLAAGAQASQTAAAAGVAAQQTAAQLELGKLSIANAGAHDQLAASVATSQINANEQLQSLLASISGDVAKTQSNNDVAKTAITVNGQTQMQQILATSLEHAYDTSAGVAQAGYNAQVAISQSHDEHSGGLFGGGGFLGLGL